MNIELKGATVTDYPVPEMAEVQLVELLKTLAEPTRLQIVCDLADGRPRAKTVAEWDVDVTKSTMSHHFKTMREAGLTRTLVRGRTHTIQLRREELDARFPGLIEALLASR